MSYYKKQKKTRSIYLNTNEAFYVNPDKTSFTFRFHPIDVEDESRMYVKNTSVDFKNAGLSVKDVKSGVFLGSTATFGATYSDNPTITFVPQDSKGSGATAIGTLAPSGLSGSATSTTTSVAITIAGAGYTGTPPTIPANQPTTGGFGATLTPAFNATTGALETATLVAGSGYEETPTFTIPAPQASLGAIFGAVPFNASTGVITGVPTITNPTTNGFYNGSLFTIGFQNNIAPIFGTASTNATGGLTSITITNGGVNGYYGTDNLPSIATIAGNLFLGTGFTFTGVYTNGSLMSMTINTAGSGYGNNLTNATLGFPANSVGAGAMISGKTITNGRLTGLTLGAGGSKYRNPTLVITAGLVAPIQGAYASVFQQPAPLTGARMLTHGSGYTLPPKPVIDTTYRIDNSGDLPLIAEIAPSYVIDKSNYYTIKIDGVKYNETQYNNTDNKALPTLAICSTNEIINNEEYTDFTIPSQVINQIILEIKDRDGLGVNQDRNLQILIIIEELDVEDTNYINSKRQLYSTNIA